MEHSFKQTLKEMFSVSALPEEAVAVAGAGTGNRTEERPAAAARVNARPLRRRGARRRRAISRLERPLRGRCAQRATWRSRAASRAT